ncbi:WbqC family protein [Burkholderia gladioli]|uniref:WbqC family protein n=1 Tax=Burkholderia gladioli TaxID=28095 RepID=UPI0016402551|nr:WbqC family protein [Burkholderia gladioli]
MIVAISQPEHFPYEGFFQKMHQCDLFVLLDDVQFSGPRSYQNRNRFLNPRGELEWFGVAVAKGSYSSLLKDVCTSEDKVWRRKVARTLFFRYGFDFSEIYSHEKLCDINIAGIEFLRDKLNIKTQIILSSELNCPGRKSEKLANICKALGASTYLCGSGGKEYLDKNIFGDILIEYHKPNVRSMMTALDLLKVR